MRKVLKWLGMILGVLIGLTLLTGVVLYPVGMKDLTRTYPGIPGEPVNIATDPGAVARGEHIATIWACTKCHGADLSGQLLAGNPLEGTITAPNLTSGKGGIAKAYTDADWVRAIRHGVKPDGGVEIEMYNYSTMSDQDLGDLIAYIKQIPPVDADYPAIQPGPAIAIGAAMGFLKPAAERIDHQALHPGSVAPGATSEYGRYLSVLCTECHSSNLARNLKKWDEAGFIRAMQTGILPDGKHIGRAMSSKTFSEMNDMELTALWLYFMDTQQIAR